ncbi:cysteine-rich RLK (RECEPTOR-like protein kinase) 8 [Hibiscus trionum]|uniref:Cysteine-rich RLK (RECEPTOR-like protein kinase) 8 n=1 Tax=Hibiscus trionum TaxID=183268 RepID=A0A9W7GU27_HIBTR|nr:cysteine-rich RLK (RECEPTOR-like protein kinase) 8 [Hibiscus trionum]
MMQPPGYEQGNLVSWGCKKQDVVSRSTAEADYHAVTCAITEILWHQSFLRELCIPLDGLPTLWYDNSSVVVSANPVMHSKFKHVELDLYFVRENDMAGQLLVNEVPAYEQVADIMTKPLSAVMFYRFRHKLVVLSLTSAT